MASTLPERTKDDLAPKRITIVIRLSSDDVIFETDNVSTVTLADLRHAVRSNRGGTTLNRRLRFIYNGHVLTPTTNIAREVVGNRDRVYVHCAIGPIMSSAEIERGEDTETPPVRERTTEPELRGFDRLRSTGFSEEDILNLRQQFGELYGTDGGVELEDQWIDDDAANTPFAVEYVRDMLAVLAGAFLGVFVIVLVKLNVLNRRQMMVVAAGAVINVVFSVLQLFS